MATETLARPSGRCAPAPLAPALEERFADAVAAVREGSCHPRVLVTLLEAHARGDRRLRERAAAELAAIPRRQLALLRAATLASYGRGGALR